MKILKFGGSSVATPDRIKDVIKILKSYDDNGEKFAVVFSAFGGVTDSLVKMSRLAAKGDASYQELFESFHIRHIEAAEILTEPGHPCLEELINNHEVLRNLLHGIFLLREASPRTVDYVLSFGERNSAFIISQALKYRGVNAEYLDTRKVIKTDKTFGSARVLFDLTYEEINKYFSQNIAIQIVTGFIATSKGGLTTTLGRGGSDYTASILAGALNAKVIEIWTDVNGVLTADPRKVNKAFTIPKLTYAEAMEMSHFGAKVIYPPTLQPALKKRIPIYIKNTFNPTFIGTLVSDKTDPKGKAVKGISSIDKIALLTLEGSGLFGSPGIAGRLFTALAQDKINIILITQGSSEHSISFAVAPKKAVKAKDVVEKAFELEMVSGIIDPVKIEENLSVVAVIGENMRYQPGIAGRLFNGLGRNGINAVAIAQGSSELNISVVIEKQDETKALNALHEAFFLSEDKVLHLFLVGVGLIGGTLLKQIEQQQRQLIEEQKIQLKVVGIANSKKMFFNENGIDLSVWRHQLTTSDDKIDISQFIQKMKEFNLLNSIFVDNTASAYIANHYDQILDRSISISTPNKIAASSSYNKYMRLKKIANKRGVQFMYETNVGAGLPVLSTIQDLVLSGDKILKIEGILSGSLSYIFNSFNGGESFKSALKNAMDAGFTEPDPRVDLSGEDVKRKLLILAREMGCKLEAEEINIHPFLPMESFAAESVDLFLETIDLVEEKFQQKRNQLMLENKRLAFIASVDNKRNASIELKSVGESHPFFNLSGSDNMIIITSERYQDRPLVVRGPGAGAEVTAAGVFAEIIKIGQKNRINY